MRENDDQRERGSVMPVSGTAADIAIAVTKQNRGKPWSELQALVSNQITPWEDAGTHARPSQRGR
jgi:hypothetical protein